MFVDDLGKSPADTHSYRIASKNEFGILLPEDEDKLPSSASTSTST